jgi:hypothetical protein
MIDVYTSRLSSHVLTFANTCRASVLMCSALHSLRGLHGVVAQRSVR